MKRLISILCLILILVAICIFEEIYLDSFTNNFSKEADEIKILVESNSENLNQSSITSAYEKLKENWDSSKVILCFFTNYDKIKAMDESLIKLKTALKNNDKSLAYENVAIISNYEEFFHYMIGFNINNLF